jgi:hypothetical protein
MKNFGQTTRATLTNKFRLVACKIHVFLAGIKSPSWILNYFLTITSILIVGSIVSQLIWSPEPFNLGKELTPLIIAIGIFVALNTLESNHRREASKEYLENATDFLSKAYKNLEEYKDESNRPINSRLNWLTAARLVCAAKNIGALLTEDSHQRIWIERKQYWRGRFRDLIAPTIEGLPKAYYAETAKLIAIGYGDDDRPPLSEKSLVELYRFIKWPEKIQYPLENNVFTEDEIEEMCLSGPRGLGQLFKEVRRIEKERDQYLPN